MQYWIRATASPCAAREKSRSAGIDFENGVREKPKWEDHSP